MKNTSVVAEKFQHAVLIVVTLFLFHVAASVSEACMVAPHSSIVTQCNNMGGSILLEPHPGGSNAYYLYCVIGSSKNYWQVINAICPVASPSVPSPISTTVNVPTERQCGSIISVGSQTVAEAISIIGTPYSLHYTSARAYGRKRDRIRQVTVFPSGLTGIVSGTGYTVSSRQIEHRVAGQTVVNTYTTNPVIPQYFEWDGKDTGGTLIKGSTFIEDAILDTLVPTPTNPVIFTQTAVIGTFYAVTAGMGGWTISSQHYYDRLAKMLHLGNGNTISAIAQTKPNGDLWVFSHNGSELYVFDSNGLHKQTRSGKKGAVLLSFNYTSGKLTSIVDAYSNSTTIQYDGSGNIDSITSPYYQVTDVDVDANGFIDSVTNPNNEIYMMTTSGTGLLLSFTRPSGVASTMTYTADGDLASDSSSAGSSLSLSTALVTGGIGTTTTTAEGIQKAYSILYPGTAGGNAFEYRSGPGNLYSESKYVLNPDNSISSSVDIDEQNLKRTIIYGNDYRHPSLVYPTSVAFQISPLTRTTTVSRSSTTTIGGDPFSLANWTETHILNGLKTTTLSYSPSLSTYTRTSPVNRTVKLVVDSNERSIQEQYSTYTAVDYTYDANGRLSTRSQGVNRVATFSYNANGFLSSIQNPLSQTISFTYDGAGRVLTTTLPDTRVITYTYDLGGNLASVTPPGGSSHSILSNGFDLIEQYTAPATTFLIGEQTTQKVFKSAKGFFDGALAKFADWISSVFPSFKTRARTLVVNRDTYYDYNDDRKLVSITRPDSQTATYTYNSTTGRLSGITTSAGNYTINQNTNYNRVDSIVSPDSVTLTYGYTGPFLTSAANSGAASGTVYFTYNNEFLTATTKVNTETAITYTYDNDGIMNQAGDEVISLNAATGFPTVGTLGSATESYSYSAAFGELSQIQGKYSTTNIYKEVITRDDLARVTQKDETIGAGSVDTYVYTFDTAGRLTTVTKNSGAYSSYTYDSNSSRTSQTIGGVTTTATYDEQDRLRTWGTKTYSYNDAGELTQVDDTSTVPTATTTFTYDVFGNMKSATLPSGDVITYVLDGQDRRVAKKVNGTVVARYLWYDATRLAAELDSGGTVVSQFIYGHKSNAPAYMIKSGVKYKIMTDHLGSIVAVVHSTAGTIAQAISYDEFGRVLSDSSPGFQPLGFAGGLYDGSTKLSLFGARSYNAEAGRWISRDPILFAGGDTNLYGYAVNDPVNFRDPKGKFPIILIPIAGGAIAGVAGHVIGSAATGQAPTVSGAITGAISGALAGTLAAPAVLTTATGGFVSAVVGSVVGQIGSTVAGGGFDGLTTWSDTLPIFPNQQRTNSCKHTAQ